jgi:hypothetical protein
MFVLKMWRMDEAPDVPPLATKEAIALTEAEAKDVVSGRLERLRSLGCTVAPMNAVRNGWVVTGPAGQVSGVMVEETADPGTPFLRLLVSVRRAVSRFGLI